jgi:SAM-dependent methyltransferase
MSSTMPTGAPRSPKTSDLDPATAARLDKIWSQAYRANSRGDLLRLYEEWAATYDADHAAIGFFGHRATAELVGRYLPFAGVAGVLDAGCGTGAAGEALWALGCRNLTGVDLSEEMLARAGAKGIYRHLAPADLGQPLDDYPCDHCDAAVLVGVFSYGQAPAHALDEVVRVVKPGGVLAFTMRVDFFEQDAMAVRSKMEELDQAHAWRLVEVSEPEQYLPNKDPEALFRVWCYRVLETKAPGARLLESKVTDSSPHPHVAG